MAFDNKQAGQPDSSHMETALIVHPELKSQQKGITAKIQQASLDDRLEEARGLACAINLSVLDITVVKLTKPVASHLIGKGNRSYIAQWVTDNKPSVVIVNHNLSPIQQRNLEREWGAKVIDRTGLILEIFGERAQTREGKIQVELASLEYQRSRLVRSWTHLERQRGGAGFMGGPGETQLEIDRRMITDKISHLKKDLEQVRKTRELQKRSREKVPFAIISLVGYTNAGKSTLFNNLTGADVYAEDLPFATLDPTMRKLELDSGQEVIISDTVGFIADLPTTLVEAFRATLDQVEYADIILHIIDVSRPDYIAQKEEVAKVMEELGIDYETDNRIFEVYNKIDALSPEDQVEILRKIKFSSQGVGVSALTGQGLEHLKQTIQERLAESRNILCYQVNIADGEAQAWLHRNAHVLEQTQNNDYILMQVEIGSANQARFADKYDYKPVETIKDDQKKLYGEKH